MADIADVRDLHAPSRFSDTDPTVYCFGCDADGYEVETPRWPCRTAEIVYSSEEVRDTQWAAKMHAKWIKQMTVRNPGWDDRRGVSWIAMAYEKVLDHALRAGPLFKNIFVASPSGKTVTFEIKKDLSQ